MTGTSDPLHLVGETLGRKYAVESLVRHEAGSVVYRATHLSSNRSVGIRVLTALAAVVEARRGALLESLARDQAKLAELGGIVPAAYPIRDVGTVAMPHGAWVPFVVLAWPHGITLRQMLTTAGVQLPESLAEVAALIEPVAVALAIAHEHGVVHGGITPDRILFRDHQDGSRRPVLLDFGVARVLRAAGVDDAGDASAEDDVRALASVLAQTIARACGADAKGDAPMTPRARGVAVEDDLESVFARALSGDSYASVGDFWSALRRSLHLAPLRSLEATIPPEIPSVASTRSLRPTAHSTPPEDAAPETPFLSRFTYAAAALVVVGLGAVTVMRASASRGDAEAAAVATPVVAPSSAGGLSAPSPCPAGMIAVSEATFHTGVAGDVDDPARDVSLHAFCMDRDAVTTADYKACSDRGDCKRASRTNEWEGIGPSDHEALDPLCTERDVVGRAKQPVNCVTWEMATTYCADRGGRLPTEAEWAIASRSTAAQVAEWVADWHAPLAAGAAGEPQVDPQGPTQGDERVVRGAHAPGAPSSRFGAAPTTRSHAIGFRCARSL